MASERAAYYTTGRQHTAEELHELADLALCWRPGIAAETAALNARICAALLWQRGWEYEPAIAHAPAVREGRRIVQKEVRGRLAGIRRHYRHQSGVGMESTPAPAILSDIAVAWHLLNGRVLIHLSDIAGDGLPHAKVGGGEGMMAIGEAYGGASAVSTLVAAILRCEAGTQATPGEHQPREVSKKMIRGKAIDMAGRRINEWYVTGRAYVDTPTISKAKWWVVCPACGVERFETGSKLRAAEEKRWVIWCRACGLNKI